jgi:hypothetical protein
MVKWKGQEYEDVSFHWLYKCLVKRPKYMYIKEDNNPATKILKAFSDFVRFRF